MKFTPEVIAAIQILKNAAENDFELHRINVLERDLNAPPTVEIIDDTHQKFDGIVYNKSKSGHYTAGVSIHRAVYAYYYGDIPDDHVVHHINEIKSDNNISNLLMMTKGEHSTLHGPKRIHPKRPKHIIKCEYCGKEVETVVNSTRRFCSNKCQKNARYHSGVDIEIRNCAFCGKEFPVDKYSTTQCCCLECTYKLKGEREIRECPVCGNSFEVKKSKKQVTCSHACGSKLMWQNRKKIKN